MVDKNCEHCQTCAKRIAYLAAVDPEFMTASRYSYSGGKTRYVNRRKDKRESEHEKEKAIRELALYLCQQNSMPLHAILNTKAKKPEIVKERRWLINNLKYILNPQNKTLAKALGIRPSTVSLALNSKKTLDLLKTDNHNNKL